MKTITCDVCGRVLDCSSQQSCPYKSDMFGYDLCGACKRAEKKIDLRKVYLEKLKEAMGK